MSTDAIVWSLAAAAVLVSLFNPGGLIIGAAIAFVLLGGRYGLPYVGDLIKQRQSGVGRAKVSQRARDGVRGARDRVDDARDDERRGRR
ncbi:hypothetical protein JCM17823_14570 [Halorubrum gandharaense]